MLLKVAVRNVMSVRWFRVFFSVEVKILFVKKLLKPLLVKVKEMLGSTEH